jgi:hypothetical protein
MKWYVGKLSKGELWPKIADDWRRIGATIKARYGKINPEYEKLIATE